MSGDRSHEREDEVLYGAWEIDSVRSLESLRPSLGGVRGPHAKVPSRPSRSDGAGEAPGEVAAPNGAMGGGGLSQTCVHLDGIGSAGEAGHASGPGPCPVTLEQLRLGDEVGGFRLIAELGRGAFARVFLAEEASLGGRRVALKISAAEGDEPQILARLQHAHIVPVHSVRDDPRTGLRLLCMPFLGGANLAQVMEEARAAQGAHHEGRSLVEALDQLSRRFPCPVEDGYRSARRSLIRSRSHDGVSLRVDPPVESSRKTVTAGRCDRPSRRFGPLRRMLERGAVAEDAGPEGAAEEMLPSRRFLRGADAVRASVWIVARLAEGLEHAHGRGLLHRDLKPSNVLIAADGTPMLLDFNLAVEAAIVESADESVARATVGGTLPYMAPEHLDALDPEGTTSPDAVDERSDLYSLGLILFEMIADAPAFEPVPTGGCPLRMLRRMIGERRRPAPSLRSRVPEVPPSLDALVAKCLDPDPARRHRFAADLAEDLRRFLDDLPMKHGPEPSLVERGRKWARRHPAVSSSSSTALAFALLLGTSIFGAFQAYEAMQGLQSRLKLRAFHRDFLECQFLLNTSGDSDARIRRGVELAASTLKSAGVDESGSAKGPLGGPWVDRLAAQERDEVRRSVVDLILEDARARVVLADREGTEEARREALARAVSRLDRLQASVDSAPSALFRERSRYRAALGDAQGSMADLAEAEARPPQTCHDWTALGLSFLSTDRPAEAEEALMQAVALDVTSFWAWFALGHCHFEQERFEEAVGDFTACVVARPEFAWGHYNRGLALARAGRPREACDAYSRAIAIDPHFAEARIDRGLVELDLDRPAAAEADLRSSLDRVRRDPRVLAALGDALARQGKTDEAERLFADLLAHEPHDAAVRTARGIIRLELDPKGAAEDFALVLSDNPSSALAHYGMARVVRERDRDAALSHLDLALRADPRLFEAVELRALERARRGDRSALDDVDVLVKAPTANRLYNAACALTILGEKTHDEASLSRAVDLLGRAFLAGAPTSAAASDPDLEPLRRRADYASATARSAVSR